MFNPNHAAQSFIKDMQSAEHAVGRMTRTLGGSTDDAALISFTPRVTERGRIRLATLANRVRDLIPDVTE